MPAAGATGLTARFRPARLLPLLLLAVTACGSERPQPAETASPTQPASVAHEQVHELRGVTFRTIAPGVWLHSAYKTMPGWGEVISNGLVVEDGNRTVLVDTAWDDDQTRAILQWARETLGRPVVAAVFTHAHSDKMGGVAALHEAGVATFAARLSNEDAPKRKLLPAGTALDFAPDGWLTAASTKAAAALGPVRLFYPGPGHTRDNIVAGLPQAGILFGGCLIRPGDSTDMGNTADGDLSHWGTAAAAAGRAFPEARIVVPSHGPPAGRELLTLTATLADRAGGARPAKEKQ